jgi:hypothetical protein
MDSALALTTATTGADTRSLPCLRPSLGKSPTTRYAWVRMQPIQRVPIGTSITCIAVYAEAFWRNENGADAAQAVGAKIRHMVGP